MYWSDADLFEWAQKGGITPFDPLKHTTWIGSKQRTIGPASIDLTLGNTVRELRRYEAGQAPVIDYNDASGSDKVWKARVDFGEYVLEPNGVVLLTTQEMVRIPENAVGVLFLRSGAGRRALEHLHCLAGDTLIDVPRDVSVHPKGIAISELAASGEEFDIYAFDEEEMRFVLTRGTAFRARSGAEMVRVSYEWVTGRELRRGSITCTPDHRLLTLRGEWVEAKDANGIRLRPFSRGFDGRYPTIVSHPLGGKIVHEHRFIASEVYGDLSGLHAHHIDGNKMNNRVENIAPIDRIEHVRMHSTGENNPFFGKTHTDESKARMRERRVGSRSSDGTRRKLSAINLGEGNGNYKPISIGQITDAYLSSGTLEGAAKMLFVSVDTLANKLRQNGFGGTVEFRKAITEQSNHKVCSVERLPDLADTYDIRVPGYENFVANGVVIHNSGFCDCGFNGELTLEVVNLSGVSWRLRPGDKLVQLAIADMKRTPINSYLQTGRYLEQHGATAFRPERERV